MSKILDLLLRPDTPDVQKQLARARFELPRLSEVYGEPFVLQLKGMPYGRALEIKDMTNSELQTVLAGDDSGIWKSEELQREKGVSTPAELVTHLLLPGEIRAVSVAVEQLSGFRKPVLRPMDDPQPSIEEMVSEDIEKN
ncbi:phage tail assembly chaperone [Lawsonibacter sp. LCP25S3_G6]|uniref:phage tail assembly chaperone n=1 Tax=unclassified Lawsonibacter TaxID=2617946 RepID=UPI003F9450FF